MKQLLPIWTHPWFDLATLGLQISLIVIGAILLRSLLKSLLERLGERYAMPRELLIGAHRIGSFTLLGAAMLLILDRLGVPGTVLWTAFTGFATVAAVAFFAAWSVLSNIFCTVLIFVTRPFRIDDWIEIIENGEKAGIGGQVVDINLIYTTLRETSNENQESMLQIPNNLFFQRTVRRRTTDKVSNQCSEK